MKVVQQEMVPIMKAVHRKMVLEVKMIQQETAPAAKAMPDRTTMMIRREVKAAAVMTWQ